MGINESRTVPVNEVRRFITYTEVLALKGSGRKIEKIMTFAKSRIRSDSNSGSNLSESITTKTDRYVTEPDISFILRGELTGKTAAEIKEIKNAVIKIGSEIDKRFFRRGKKLLRK